jgi:hypothetical protein
MVRIKLKTKRPAVAMIEMIFALVIMAIVMMSAPMLISTSQTSTSIALQQEGINEAVSRINMIMGYAWDESNTNSAYAPILHTTVGHPDLAMVATRARRAGTPQESQRTFIFSDINSSNLFTSTSLGLEAGETDVTADDIDDFIGLIGLTAVDSAAVDYVEKTNVSLTTDITYSSDSIASGYNRTSINYNPFTTVLGDTTNIKSIVVTLRSTDSNNSDILDKQITFRAFSSNIGTYTLEERTF